MRTTRVESLVCAVFACATAPASGQADGRGVVGASWDERHPETASISVSYSDLDLSLPQARRTLDARIDAAARQLCWKVVDTRFLDDQITCRGAAIYRARDQVRRAVLQAQSAAPPIALEATVRIPDQR